MALNFANNNSLSAITSLPASTSGGGMTLISEQTASSSSTISFTSGIDSTYKEYIFKFIDIHAGTQNALFQVGFRDGGTDYDATKTTTVFGAYQYEDDNDQALGYRSARDLAQSTSFQDLILYSLISDGNDSCLVGTLHLFNPSSSVFVKHFMATTNSVNDGNGSDRDYTDNSFIAGYCNTTTAIDGVQFKMSSGTFNGLIKLYGVS
jgi:hypothetical protein